MTKPSETASVQDPEPRKAADVWELGEELILEPEMPEV